VITRRRGGGGADNQRRQGGKRSLGLTNVEETRVGRAGREKIVTGSTLGSRHLEKAADAARRLRPPDADSRGPAAYRTKMAGDVPVASA